MKINISDIDMDEYGKYIDNLRDLSGNFTYYKGLDHIIIVMCNEITKLKEEIKKMKEGDWDAMDN